ncbi:CpaF family protein [Paenibacillus sp. 19GGS1-52]|uniref:CpaF family protein n=1 Tax=Paenibacillus sp. 19GGS1-52 TaxID=2758563 RepID=UPI001EFB0BF3|nr:ATPase, T2SS/T4P/T4SS family [Paenibacillus sp. 19GGS1-52]ULO07139.1 CpaF family protein [Paenibacillus sp. 19GGS1-52]
MTRKAQVIAFANLGGGDAIQGVMKLLRTFPKDQRIVVAELPCVGLPRIAYTFDQQIADLHKERTMDQFLLDLDRQALKPVHEYMVQRNGVDYVLVNPRAQPESPVIRKLSSNQTLISAPVVLRQLLEADYDVILLVTQGTLIQPTTHFALRTSDAAVLYSADAIDFVGNYTHYCRLIEVFAVERERLFLFTVDTNVNIDEAPIYTKFNDLLKHWKELEPKELSERKGPYLSRENETVGIIEPLEYLNVQISIQPLNTELSEGDAKKLESLLNFVRFRLQGDHLDEYVQSLTHEPSRQKIRYYISDLIREQSEYALTLPLSEAVEWVQKEITELGVLQEILDDPKISSIEINGPDEVIVEQDGIDVHRPDIRFQSVAHLYEVINKMLMPIGKPISSTDPIVDANYRGFRICVVADTKEFQGISANAPLISIRKFPPDVYTDEQCIQYGNISQEIADFLHFIVPKGANIVIGGGTNSGKTTQLIRLPMCVEPITRIISIEDSEEMMLASKTQYMNYPNLPSLLVKEVEDEKKSYGIAKLIKACLRLKPTFMCIGEIRDEPAAQQSLIGMNTGHSIWTTIHANSAKEAATRFLQLNGNTPAAASQISGSIDLILFQKKLSNGARVVTELSELVGYRGTEEPILNPIFKYDYSLKRHVRVGKIQSEALLEKIYLKDPAQEDLRRWCEVKELRAI